MRPIPASVLDFLQAHCYEDCTIKEHTLKREDLANNMTTPLAKIIQETAVPYYKDKKPFALNGMCQILLEPLKNAYEHGPKEPIELALLMSPSAFVAGFYDGGEYFQMPEVKQAWEERKQIPVGHMIPGNKCSGSGNEMIYCLFEFIHVDAGTLYLGIPTSSMIFQRTT